MNKQTADAILERAKEDQVILEPWDRPSGEIRLVDLKGILNSLVSEDEFRPFVIHHLSEGNYEIFPLETDTEIAKRLIGEYVTWHFKKHQHINPSLREFRDWLGKKDDDPALEAREEFNRNQVV